MHIGIERVESCSSYSSNICLCIGIYKGNRFSDISVAYTSIYPLCFLFFFSWSFLEVTTSNLYNDSIQAYAAGAVEAAVTSQVSSILQPCAAGNVLFTGNTAI